MNLFDVLLISGVAEGPSDFLVFLGRMHPLAVHLPIGFLLLAALVEWVSKKPKFQPLKNYTHYIWGLGSISAFFAVLFGYFLSLSGDYNEDTLFWHKWMGVAVFLFSLAFYFISKKQWKLPLYGKPILISLIVFIIFYTGHLGGNLTHGSTYLLEYAPNVVRNLAGMPDKAIPREKVTVLDSADVYLDLISPILDRRCVSCHNDDKKKGDLDLTSYSNLALGGENGEVVVPSDLNASDLYRRITLPETHDDFMPTEGKPPLSDEEVAIIGWWIQKNVPAEGYFTEMGPDEKMRDLVEKYLELDKNNLLSRQVEVPRKAVVDSLLNYGFILNRLMMDNNFLEANFSLSEQELDDQAIQTLLGIKDQVIWLNLSNSGIKNAHLEQIGQLENLIKLNLSTNAITDDGLTHLSQLQNLESINLYKTSVSNGLLALVPQLPNLKRLYLSESNVDSITVAGLQREHPGLKIVFEEKP
ncbi:c-type cytochrome domain-containing protein [Flagellimonas sp.]|uniref:c-type cytochrome domain-containing protein n=1 Tax=Flagellimonas sp. TaxID=2058762 RepID=UPI003B4FFDB2